MIEEVTAVIDSLENSYQSASGLEKDVLAFQLGKWIQNPDLNAESESEMSKMLFNWSMFKEHRYDEVKQWLELTGATSPASPAFRHLSNNCNLLISDFAFVAEIRGRAADGSADGIDQIALGKLAVRQFDYEKALNYFKTTLEADIPAFIKTEARTGISDILNRQQDYQASADTLMIALRDGGFSDNLLFALGSVSIRLGNVRDATRLFELSIKINPHHEYGHYFLGNGYCTLNYSQLSEKYPQSFPAFLPPDPPERLLKDNPEWVRPYVMLAERAWSAGDLKKAEELCCEALRICPDYGRAHAMLSKVFEGYRQQVNIHFDEDNADFEGRNFPEIPDIEKYVVNWRELSERHQKRVALSLQPWASFIPVLAATGQTHYIKPLVEKLSECPSMEEMSGLRIGLDSRLWDDVRGAGGYNTVTGIEDVERTIFRNYNTVLHELTHQVHGILTEPEKQRIEETFRAAKAREESGNKTFISRYQMNNPWEYFAEGVNSYYSSRRDEFDSREIVRERLFDLDPALVELVEHFTSLKDMSPYFVVGMVKAANQLLEKAKAGEAMQKLMEIAEDQHDDREWLLAFSNISSILGNDANAITTARRSVELYPADAEGYRVLSEVLRNSSSDAIKSIQVLDECLRGEEVKPRHDVYVKLGWFCWELGRYKRAVAMFDSSLKYQADLPYALWGLGECYADLSLISDDKRDNQFKRAMEYYKQVIPHRSGMIDLRLSYARLLIQHGKIEEATEQINEAENLRPDDPLVGCYIAWLAFTGGDSAAANKIIVGAAQLPASPDLARALRACFESKDSRIELLKEIEFAIPYWEFNPRNSEYKTFGKYPEWQRRLLREGIASRRVSE